MESYQVLALAFSLNASQPPYMQPVFSELSSSFSRTPAEAPLWSRFPRHLQDLGFVAGRARGGGGRAFRPRLCQPRRAAARADCARVGHALPPPAKHFPCEGVDEE